LLVHHRIANDQPFPLTVVLVIVANGKPRHDQHSPRHHDQLAKSCPPSPFRKRRLRKETKKFLVERATAAFTDEAGNVIETQQHAGDFKEW
jgi:hypothetical protein